MNPRYEVVDGLWHDKEAEPGSFQAIDTFFKPNYSVTAEWNYLKNHLNGWRKDMEVITEPNFQRAHVWTKAQRSAYVEYILKGGPSGRDIYWNCACWDDFNTNDPIVLVDGLQRLTSALMFLNNKISAYGRLFKDYTGHMGHRASFTFHVHNLKTEREVLQWYLQINASGTPHTKKEIDKVRQMLKEIEENEKN